MARRPSSEEMAFVDIVVAFDHLYHVYPPIREVLKLPALYIRLEGVFQEYPVVKLYVEVDGFVAEVA